jgi:hypothetical protein
VIFCIQPTEMMIDSHTPRIGRSQFIELIVTLNTVRFDSFVFARLGCVPSSTPEI